MSRWNALVLTALVMLSAAAVRSQSPVDAAGMKRGQDVIATVAKWAEAVRDRDVKALDQIFDDDVIITTMDGRTRGKVEELDAFKPNPNIRYASVANEDVAMKLFGDIVVVTGLTKMRMVGTRNNESRLAMRYTAVFAKKDGLWKIVALQTVRAPQSI